MHNNQVKVNRSNESAKVIGRVSRVLEGLSPNLAAGFAERVFLTPTHFRISAEQREFLRSGVELKLCDGRHKLRGWRWGSGPAILLSHGWGAAAAQFHELALALVGQGYSVIAFDHPGHGASSGKLPTLYNFYDALKCINEIYGPFSCAIGHSIGALALGMLSADGHLDTRLVLISPLSVAGDVMQTFSAMTGISRSTLDRMRNRIESRYGRSFSEGSLFRLRGLTDRPIHVIHDQQDRFTSWERTSEWVEENEFASLLTTQDLGHSRILADPQVIQSILDFVGPASGDIRSQMLSEFAL